jgi:hypothetical protein
MRDVQISWLTKIGTKYLLCRSDNINLVLFRDAW